MSAFRVARTGGLWASDDWLAWTYAERQRVSEELRALADRVDRGDVEWVADGREVAAFTPPSDLSPLREIYRQHGIPPLRSPVQIKFVLDFELSRSLRPDLTPAVRRLIMSRYETPPPAIRRLDS